MNDTYVKKMNYEKHIKYWRTGSDEDWAMVELALENNKIRHGLFFLHLAMEKLIKAHVVRVTEDLPPRIHNLLSLMERANLTVNQEVYECLDILNRYCLKGRYPDEEVLLPSPQVAAKILQQVKEIRAWLISQL